MGQKEETEEKQERNNFAKGSIVVNILKLAVPMTLAQLINVLYNIEDRLYIGQLKDEATLSLTGLGLCLPIISIVIAFANLFGMGGAPKRTVIIPMVPKPWELIKLFIPRPVITKRFPMRQLFL